MISDIPCMIKGIDKEKASYGLNVSKMKQNRKLKIDPYILAKYISIRIAEESRPFIFNILY